MELRQIVIWFGLGCILVVTACGDDSATSGGKENNGLDAPNGFGDSSTAGGDAANDTATPTLDTNGTEADVPPFFPDGFVGKDGEQPDGKFPGSDVAECGGFGQFCQGNSDCCSGFCVENFDGFQCTDLCIEECPEGFDCKAVLNTYPDVVTICVPKLSKLCHACKTDFQCNGGTCETFGDKSYCTADCSTSECPTGYNCEEAENGAKRCVPANGTCDCTPENNGVIRPCAVKNDNGICSGFETCVADSGWTTCDAKDPSPEECNGLDDDCDGVVDEGLPISQPCSATTDFGTCEGEAFCLGGAGWVCSALDPQAEICDFKDNNCDGEADETFKNAEGKYADVLHCGGCGKSCEGLFPNGTSICDTTGVAPQCAVGQCNPGYYLEGKYQCLPVQDTQCQECVADFQCAGGVCVDIGGKGYCTLSCTGNTCPGEYQCLPANGPDGAPKSLACIPKTGACDCLLPSDTGKKRPCSAENAIGTCFGFETCNPPGGWGACDAGAPSPELCNGLDDDCNGFIDDALPVSEPCQSSKPNVGTCTGEQFCFGSAGWVCNAVAPDVELCDYKDNNCNGDVDEAFKNGAGKYASEQHCGACGTTCANAIPNAVAICDASLSTPQCVVDSCAPGFYKINDYLCLKEGESYCKPCQEDLQCDGKSCVVVGDGTFCTDACAVDEDCPAGYGCSAVAGGGTYCVPANGTCDCTPDTAGAKKPCEAANDLGTCVGFSICDPQVGWLECNASAPATEICDGKDNDCNGIVDDGLPVSQDCSQQNEFGTCAGKSTCVGSQGWVCSAKIPAAEICDFADNDCDALVDENFKDATGKYASSEHCGTCNSACGNTIANAESEVCDATKVKPQCVATKCKDGFFKLNDFQCIETPEVTCFPCTKDADCFGGVCADLDNGKSCVPKCTVQQDCEPGFLCTAGACVPESGSCDCTQSTAGVKKLCSVENNVGVCVGFSVCDPKVGWTPCDASTPVVEVCNGIDDDCDGIPDDGLPATQPCEKTNGFGKCTGQSICLGAQGWVCQATEPAKETCDFVDNDCDGQVDEDFKNAAGKYGSAQHCGTCGKACGGTVANSQTEICDVTKQVPQCIVESCLPGYFKQSDLQCILQPAVSCSPCVSDDSCFGAKCTTVGASKFCLPSCGAGKPCDAGYSCVNSVCQPANGSCDCSEATAGAKRTCQSKNAIGTCLGFETCDPKVGWTGCTAAVPANEDCDGKDNDCNGLVDDGLPTQQVCAQKNDYGICSGFAQCYGSAGWVCLAPTPAADICDFKDNDCDGQVDEDYKDAAGKYTVADHCGTCNNKCGDQYPNSLSEVCDATKTVPQCIVSACEVGYLKLNDFQCLEIPPIACEPCSTDANCFGATCMEIDQGKFCVESCNNGACAEGYFCSGNKCLPWNGTCDCNADTAGAKRTCSQQNGIGKCYGFETCDPKTGWGPCDAPNPKNELCNGLDDDCDGFIDDGLPATQACENTNAFGKCAGLSVCYGTIGWFCQAPQPSAEICDFKDNDCDGLVDEDFKTADGKYGSNDHCGGCGISCSSSILNAVAECDPTLVVPQCVVTSCLDGWQKYNDFLCIPLTSTLCEPCATDVNCIGENAKCIPLVDGLYCSISCSDDLDCPSGYFCQNAVGTTKQCVPATSSCTCDGSNLDLQMGCSITYAPPGGGPQTTCFGSEYCTASGWTGCIVPTETCNNQDDNCDGLVDEPFKTAGKYATNQHCGKCNKNCAALDYVNAVGICNAALETPDCAMKCNTGYWDVNENPADGCECNYLSAVDYPDGIDQNCDGVDGEIQNGIFVSKEGKDTNPGTIDAPKATITEGLKAAVALKKRDVYVATGVYSENIALAAGIGVYGGYNVTFDVHESLLYETAIIGQSPTALLKGAVNASDIKGAGEKTRLDGFTVFGFQNKATSGNSYGIYVKDCDSKLEITNNRVFGGSGGNGSPGAKGTDGSPGQPGQKGTNAQDVGTGCTGLKTSGGTGGAQQCGGVDVSGGKGGDGYCPAYAIASQNSNETGKPGANGGGGAGEQGYDGLLSSGSTGGGSTAPGCVAKSTPGCGGCPCQNCVCGLDSFCCTTAWDAICVSECQAPCGQSCSGGGAGGSCGLGQGCNQCLIPQQSKSFNGQDGVDGKSGTFGSAGLGCASSAGSVVNGEWIASTGTTGGGGNHGSGGGGGGAGGGTEVCGCGGHDVGGTGGGGGSGGCAGIGGIGGTGGGGAFAMFFVYTTAPASAPKVTGNVVQRGSGGTGGVGGNGGVGGLPGLGGSGGKDGSGNDATWCAGQGGFGGSGGGGGHGGGGGGGCGGASFGIFVSGQGGTSFAAIKTANQFVAGGAAGQGGQGGLSLGNSGLPGQPGGFDITNF